MRIGFVSTYPPIECGIATYTYYLNTALRKIGNETFVMSQFGAQGEGVFPVYQPESSAFAASVFYTSVRMTPDVMHIQHEYGLFGPQKGVEAVELLLRYRLAGVPVVTTLHTVYSDLDDQEYLLLKYIVDESSAIIVHEDFQRDTLLEHFGGMKHIAQKTNVIEHGIREVGPVKDAKKKLGLEDKKIILLSGYFRPSKGFHKIVEIFPEIAKEDDDVILVVAGKTRNIEFDQYRREFFTLIHNSPVLDRIKIFRGQFPQYTFDTILSAADVVVLPYERGAQSGMMAQCFANNAPVIASNLPAFRLLIERSGGGLICEKDEDYAKMILRLLNDKKLQEQIKEAQRKYIRTRGGWSKIAEKHIKVYHNIVTVPYGKARYVYFPQPDDERRD